LTIIKRGAPNHGRVEPLDKGGLPVPTETVILLVIIVAIFSVFASALAWGDYQTRRLPVRK
jgi:hypothetical protein